MTNAEKKAFLLSYRDAVRAAREAEEEFAQLELSLLLPRSPAFDSIGGGNGGGLVDLSAYRAQLQEVAERDVLPKRARKLAVRRAVLTAIESLPTEREQLVMRTRYLHLRQSPAERALNREGTLLPSWDMVAELCSYSRRAVLSIHGVALAHLDIQSVH